MLKQTGSDRVRSIWVVGVLLAIICVAFVGSGFLQAATITTAGGGLTAIGQGRTGPGVAVPSSLANAPGATPFALDELNFGGVHLISHLNDSLYGNSNSWIGNGATGASGPFVGIDLNGSHAIDRIAFGRDNTGTFNDRSVGTYTLQFRNDGSTADDGGWSTIGTINYGGSQNPPAFNSGPRHEFAFNPVSATAVRLLVPGTGIGGGTAIDEVEVFAGNSAPPTPPVVSAPGGSYGANNVALQTNSAIAFAQDLIGNGSFAPTHTIPNLNNGTYGNASSWIGNNNAAISSFAGVNLNGVYTVDSVAFGRDNTGTFSDRAQGAYTIQVTSVANPSAATADSDWRSIGLVGIDGATPSPGLRRQYSFPAIAGVTGVRVITSSGQLDIDELEVTGAGKPTFTLLETGVHSPANVVPNNLARSSNGAVAFAKDVINFPSRHTIPGINDGNYGNSKSWIGNSPDSFLGVDLNGQFRIDRVAWGRDNGGDESPDFPADSAFSDRTLGLYTLQVTMDPNPNAGTPDASWVTIGSLAYGDIFPDSPSTRHLWQFDAVSATGVRLLTPAGAAIDEFEVFAAVPEPTSALLGMLACGALVLRTRRRRI